LLLVGLEPLNYCTHLDDLRAQDTRHSLRLHNVNAASSTSAGMLAHASAAAEAVEARAGGLE
jgi:hypothetical protein